MYEQWRKTIKKVGWEQNLNTIRSLLPPKNKRISSNISDSQENNQNSLSETVKKFNEFFCSIGKDLANKIRNDNPKLYKKYLKNRIASSMYLEPPTICEIVGTIRSLGVNKL